MIHIKNDEIQVNFPFITCVQYGDEEYVGIIINNDIQVTSMYDFGIIKTDSEKKRFLELGEIWWWESNRLIPINMFLKTEWSIFKPYIRTFNNKSLTIVHGPICSMLELAKRKSKRKSITLVKKMI